MKAVVLLSFILCFCCTLQASSAAESSSIDLLIKIVILYVETLFKYFDTVTILSNPAPVEFNTTNYVEGSLECANVSIYGIGGLDVEEDYVSFESDWANKKLSLGLNVVIPSEMGVKVTNYDADLALFRGLSAALPLYGTGNITLGLKSFKLNISMDIELGNPTLNLTNVTIRPLLGLAKLNLTGFWNNPDISKVLSKIFTGLSDLLVIFWDLELNCISCALATSLESFVNQANIWNEIKNNCQEICLPSSYSFMESAFNIDDLSQFVANVSEDDIVGYIKIAREYVNARLESEMTK